MAGENWNDIKTGKASAASEGSHGAQRSPTQSQYPSVQQGGRPWRPARGALPMQPSVQQDGRVWRPADAAPPMQPPIQQNGRGWRPAHAAPPMQPPVQQNGRGWRPGQFALVMQLPVQQNGRGRKPAHAAPSMQPPVQQNGRGHGQAHAAPSPQSPVQQNGRGYGQAHATSPVQPPVQQNGRGNGQAHATSPMQPPVQQNGRGYGSAPRSADSCQEAGISSSSIIQKLEQLNLRPQEARQPTAPETSSRSTRFPLRPGMGKKGMRCLIRANHFIVDLPYMDLHHYDVSIIPESTSRAVNRAVVSELVKLYRLSHLGNKLPAYDGRRSLYTAGPLPFATKEFAIFLVDEDCDNGSLRREREFRVVLKLATRVNLHHLAQYLQGRQADTPQEALQVLDIVLRELPNKRYIPVGRSFYSADLLGKQRLGEGVESWRGFYQSLRPTQMGLSLNIDVSSTAFIEPLPVVDFVSQLLGRNVAQRRLSNIDFVKVKKTLRTVKVEVTHRGKIRRKYRICGLASLPPRELTFAVDEKGTRKSVFDYFQETYGYIIQHVDLPCLQVGNPQKPNYLPMEVCKIVDGQRYSKRLNDRQITGLLKATCQRPQQREHSIIQTVRENPYNSDAYAEEFGINISHNLATVEARVLSAPQLNYNDTGKEKYCVPYVGKWNMVDKKVLDGGTVDHWVCINFSNARDIVASAFCDELARMCQTTGMAFNLNPVLPPQQASPTNVERALKTVYFDALTKLQGTELDFLIAILPNENNSQIYGDLKRICETEIGLLSQCCLSKHAFKRNKQCLANLALKINVKVGGRNTVLNDAISKCIPVIGEEPTIIFGADVSHPHPGEDSSPSIAAVVASQDWPEVTKYVGLVSAQAHRQELVQDLFNVWIDPQRGTMTGGMVKDLLKSFYTATGRKPSRIIFYRDGVSDGQFHQVLFHELEAIRKACSSIESNYQPRVTFVVVQKRHHTRLFPYNHYAPGTVDQSGNILPGTVVDSMICHPTEFDFYLCSHAGIQGTSRPAHYHVLWDENSFTADGIQTLTNDLCYTFARCTRSVSIVPPAYYAHLAAFRARYYMEGGSSSDHSGFSGGIHPTRTQNGNAAVRPLPAIKDNVQRVMFFC